MIKKVILMNHILLVIFIAMVFFMILEGGVISEGDAGGRTMGILTSLFIMLLAPFVTALALKTKSRGMRRISYMTNGFIIILSGLTLVALLASSAPFQFVAILPFILPFIINIYALIKPNNQGE